VNRNLVIGLGGRALGWTLLSFVAVAWFLATVQPGQSLFVVGVAALTPWWSTLALGVGIVSIWRRKWSMVCVAGLLVCVSLALIVPGWWPVSSATPPVGTWRLHIFDANVRYNNPSLRGIAAEIQSDSPQVVALEEISPSNIPSLLDSGVLSGYRWHLVEPLAGSGGFGLWSDIPMTGAQIWTVTDHQEVEATLRPTAGPAINLLVVHTLAPRGPGQPGLWGEEMRQIATRVRETANPLIIVGDLNATTQMKQFRKLSRGLHDAAGSAGEGWRMTWPRNVHIIPTLLRPDHLLYSSGLTVTGYRVGRGEGSDHRPLLVTLARAA
jgi:endonuclease/exonuclease/phosphatase (EEP) superfamily protein YafD